MTYAASANSKAPPMRDAVVSALLAKAWPCRSSTFKRQTRTAADASSIKLSISNVVRVKAISSGARADRHRGFDHHPGKRDVFQSQDLPDQRSSVVSYCGWIGNTDDRF